MLLKKIFSMMLAGCFATTMLVSTASAELKVSGSVNAMFANITTPNDTWGLDVDVDQAGTKDSASYMWTWYYETELKFKAEHDMANGWKSYAEVEFEIYNDNNFQLEEASANVDMGPILLSFGVLEDWGINTGAVYLWGIDDTSSKFDDEEEAIRVALKGVENLKADLKLRAYPNVGGGGIQNTTETRIQTQYNFGMGKATLVYATLADAPFNSVVAGDYAHTATNMHIGVDLNFGPIGVFFSQVTNSDKETAAAAGSKEIESVETQTFLGADYNLSPGTDITFNYSMRTKDVGEMDTPYARTGMGLGLQKYIAPVAFHVTYVMNNNNYKEASGIDTNYDASSSCLTAGVWYGF